MDVGYHGRASEGREFCQFRFGKKVWNSDENLPNPLRLQVGEHTDIPFVFLSDEEFPLHKSLMKKWVGV